MNKYIVYFEFYGRKMKSTVYAVSLDDAKKQITEKVKFHEIKLISKSNNPSIMDFFSELFGVNK